MLPYGYIIWAGCRDAGWAMVKDLLEAGRYLYMQLACRRSKTFGGHESLTGELH